MDFGRQKNFHLFRKSAKRLKTGASSGAIKYVRDGRGAERLNSGRKVRINSSP